ncbi:MAG TPA: S8 family peptidase [Longimicrobium sp.]|jgi:subtilisin family serine protease|uniref:S8 family peptidase n=1 Tax=Longimicrobium sp. TaxID=2029185 RepID=UPI002EDB8054
MKLSKTAVAVGAVMALAACSDESPVSARADLVPVLSAGARGIEGQYIVVVREGADARSVAAVAGASPRYVYTAAINGFAATLNAGQLNALQRNPDVETIEQDQVAQASATQSGATWGIDRIDQRSRPLSGTYTYTTTASSVYAYIIDTGIYAAHSNFGGRASNVYDAFGGNGNDCNGHGTHVAGTVGSATYGVAKGVRLRGVRVLDCAGSGSFAGIIAGIDWVRVNRTNPAVANLSLGGGYSSTLNNAVTNLANSGVFVAVAAGNENQPACNVSPASAPAVTTVASSTSSDAKSSFSNYGSCVDVYAPGSSITSTWSNGGTNTISGTSMASPHVAGVGALYKATYGNASQSTIDSWIKNNATANVITGNPTGTPNRLLYKALL